MVVDERRWAEVEVLNEGVWVTGVAWHLAGVRDKSLAPGLRREACQVIDVPYLFWIELTISGDFNWAPFLNNKYRLSTLKDSLFRYSFLSLKPVANALGTKRGYEYIPIGMLLEEWCSRRGILEALVLRLVLLYRKSAKSSIFCVWKLSNVFRFSRNVLRFEGLRARIKIFDNKRMKTKNCNKNLYVTNK